MPPSAETTSRSIVISCADTVREMIRLPERMRVRFPPTRSTRYGACSTPPFAIAPYAAAICRPVTPMPWPMGRLPIVEPDQCSGGTTMPGDSPGKSMPVGLPKPKRAIQPDMPTCVLATFCASVTVPMFDDCERIWATDMTLVGRHSCSRIRRSATMIEYGSVKRVVGVTSFSESAAATVTTLNVEPGS